MGDHPVEVPPELVQQWWAEENYDPFGVAVSNLANKAAQWGAGQEMEACCDWLEARGYSRADVDRLRAARRPKPQTLAEQALRAAAVELNPDGKNGSVIIAALNRLAELEDKQ